MRVPAEDIQALHRLPNSTLVLRIWKRTEESAWTQLISAIKTGGNKAMNLYLNFHLTHRRSQLVYHLRQHKKNGVISKFQTDENGTVSVKIRDQDQKLRLTYYRKKDKDIPEFTFTVDELSRLVQSKK